MGTQEIGQKIKEELLGRKDELTRIDSEDYSNKRFDQLIIRNSISKHISYLILSITLTILLLMPDKEGELNLIMLFKNNSIWAIIICFLPLTTLYFGIRGLINRKPKLIVDTEGIKADNWELSWNDIIETKFRFLKGKTTLLLIKTQTIDKEIDIGDTNISSRLLGHHIELLKKDWGKKYGAQQRL